MKEEYFDNIREYLATPKPARKQKQPYKKSDSIRELERLHYERKRLKYPDNPYLINRQFSDKSANDLTRAIVAWLELHGHFAGRVNVTGTYNHKLQKYIYSGSCKGMSDVTSVINGRHVSVEIKYGKDRMRPDQLKVKQEIEKAGGIYLVVKSFDDFLEQMKRNNLWYK